MILEKKKKRYVLKAFALDCMLLNVQTQSINPPGTHTPTHQPPTPVLVVTGVPQHTARVVGGGSHGALGHTGRHGGQQPGGLLPAHPPAAVVRGAAGQHEDGPRHAGAHPRAQVGGLGHLSVMTGTYPAVREAVCDDWDVPCRQVGCL